MDRLELYKQLLTIKPFFQKVELYTGPATVHETGRKTRLRQRAPAAKTVVRGGALSNEPVTDTVGIREWLEVGHEGGSPDKKISDRVALVAYS